MIESPIIDCEFRFYGLRRSGNHAVINWILSQVEGVSAFYNDTLPEAPYSITPRYINQSGQDAPTHLALSLLSFEDRSFRLLSQCEKHLEKHQIRSPKKRIDILIMRDPFNLFASRMKSPDISHHYPDYNIGLTLPQIAVEYLDAFISKRSPVTVGVPAVFVNFNRWKNSVEYRHNLANQLGLNFTDAGFSKVSQFGGGSSFDGRNVDISRLNVESRWKSFANDPEFHALFRNPKIIELARLEFSPFDADLEALIHESIVPLQRRSSTFWDDLKSKIFPPVFAFMRARKSLLKVYRKINSKSL
jgi:hypothetical protein